MKSPGVNYPPPLWFVVPGFVAWFLDRSYPLPVASGAVAPSVFLLGCLLLVASSGLLVWALLTFARLRTGIYPNQAATRVVEIGPYRFSRNPMYTALALVTVAIGIVANSWWIIGVAPIGLIGVYLLVVKREERYLTATFGENYTNYTTRVRRWL